MLCTRRSEALAVLAVLIVGIFFAGGLRASVDKEGPRLLFASVEVNHQKVGVVLLAGDDAGQFFVDAATLNEWRLPVPAAMPVELADDRFYPLAALAGVEAELDHATMHLTVTSPPELLSETRRSLAARQGGARPAESAGAYLDYDLAYTRDSTEAGHALSGLISPTIFFASGNFSSNLLYNSRGNLFGVADSGSRRLETTWTRDNPDRMRSIRVGDGLTESSSWARSVRFGGFQIARNFGTRPTEVTFPQPSIVGTAVVPSVLDIYVNGQMRSQLEVPGGAFEIEDIPVVTGAGQVRVVARDLLGREQVISQDFYASEQLLKPGLSSYSFSLGRLRENFTLTSNDYGEALLSASYRRGISSELTLAGRVDATSQKKVLGFSLARTFGRAGLSSLAFAQSSSRRSGTLWLVGHQYQGRRLRGDIRAQGTSSAFTQPGIENVAAFPKRQVSVSAGIGLQSRGSFGASLVTERRHNGEKRRIASLSYSRSLGFGMLISVAASRVQATTSYTETSITFNRSLGPRHSTAMSYTRRADGRRLRLDYRYELPTGPGVGYRASVQQGAQEINDAEFLLNTAFARYGIEVQRHENSRAVRLQSRGSLARIDNSWFVAREISDGFAVVDAGGFQDVRVYHENRMVGRTREDGKLLVPGMRPYEVNRLRVETADIPLTARISEPLLSVSPFYRSGAVVSFGVENSRSLVLRLVDENGRPVAEGSRARFGGGEFRFPVGLDGRLYLEGAEPAEVVEVLSAGAVCRFELPEFDRNAAFVELGEMQCRAQR